MKSFYTNNCRYEIPLPTSDTDSVVGFFLDFIQHFASPFQPNQFVNWGKNHSLNPLEIKTNDSNRTRS
jgi:hypothetical protein